MQIIHELQSSVYWVVKSGRQTTKGFQPCLWSLLVSVKSPQGSLQRCGERAVGWGSSHTLPLPLLCGTYQGKGLFRFWNNLPQGQLPWPISFSKWTHTVLKMKSDVGSVMLQPNSCPRISRILSQGLCSSVFMPWMTYRTISAFENCPHPSNSQQIFVPMKSSFPVFPRVPHSLHPCHFLTIRLLHIYKCVQHCGVCV